jgi:leucyl/phenylalanyl-tRNA--protein transferase
MFARQTDASKIAFWHAVKFLQAQGIELIDCQLPSAHMTSLGAKSMSRSEFLALVGRLTSAAGEPGSFTRRFAEMFAPEAETDS